MKKKNSSWEVEDLKKVEGYATSSRRTHYCYWSGGGCDSFESLAIFTLNSSFQSKPTFTTAILQFSHLSCENIERLNGEKRKQT